MCAKPLTVGLLDHMGGGNLGDDSTQTAVIAGIRCRWPNATIFGLSMNPADTELRHAIRSYPIRHNIWINPARSMDPSDMADVSTGPKSLQSHLMALVKTAVQTAPDILAELRFLAASMRVMRQLDLLVISGGGQLLDSWGGAWAYPYTILKWTLLAKASGCRCYFINVGAGPLRSRLSRLFVRSALRLADYVALRDMESRSLLRQIGFSGNAQVYPDCVYGLANIAANASQQPTSNGLAVGVSPMAYCDPRRYWMRDQAAYDAFIAKMVAFCMWLRQHHYQPKLFSTDTWFDAQTLQAVDTSLRQASHDGASFLCLPAQEPSLETLLSQLAGMDYIVTCRFHGVVFAHLMQIPVIALSHHPKVTGLMQALGLSQYCLSIGSFDETQLAAAFLRMVENRTDIQRRMREKASEFTAALTHQFDQLFPVEKSQ